MSTQKIRPRAADRGLALCLECRCVLALPHPEAERRCPRCGARVRRRKPESATWTWALCLTALVLYFPANLLPVMQVDYLGVRESSTIMDGIVYFFRSGSYALGAVILTASVLVPLFKIAGLLLVLCSVRFRWRGFLRHKTLMFRFVRFIGKWSMLDVFVIALLMSQVQFGFFSTIEAGPGAAFFCGVVVATMLAALKFDTRLLWDA